MISHMPYLDNYWDPCHRVQGDLSLSRDRLSTSEFYPFSCPQQLVYISVAVMGQNSPLKTKLSFPRSRARTEGKE